MAFGKKARKAPEKAPDGLRRKKPQTPVPPQRPQSPQNAARPQPAQNRQNAQSPQPPRRPQEPQDRQQPKKRPLISRAVRKAAKRSTENKSRPRKTRKVRGGNYALYYVLAGIVVVIVLVILANTVLFKCTRINVEESERYSAEEIIAASGVEKGDNLLHINTSAAADKIVNALVYVDEATVKKSFPTAISISVKEAEKVYCVSEQGVTAAISRNGKVLENCEADGLPVVKGYDAESLEPGCRLRSKTDGKTEIPDLVFKAADRAGLKNITVIDVSDRFSVKITVDDRVILNIGTATEIDSKLAVAVEIIEHQLGREEYVTLILTNPEKVPVQNNSLPHKPRPAASSSSSSSSEANHEPDPDEPDEPDPDEPDPDDPDPDEPDPDEPDPDEPDPDEPDPDEPDPDEPDPDEPDPDEPDPDEPDDDYRR